MAASFVFRNSTGMLGGYLQADQSVLRVRVMHGCDQAALVVFGSSQQIARFLLKDTGEEQHFDAPAEKIHHAVIVVNHRPVWYTGAEATRLYEVGSGKIRRAAQSDKRSPEKNEEQHRQTDIQAADTSGKDAADRKKREESKQEANMEVGKEENKEEEREDDQEAKTEEKDQTGQKTQTEAQRERAAWPQRRWPPPPCCPCCVYEDGCWSEGSADEEKESQP